MFSDPAAQLRSHGLSVTAQRLAVLRAVALRPHGSAETIADAVRADIGAVSRQAVYDALGLLTEKGLIRRLQPPGSPALFDPRVGDEHDHAICRACGAVADVDEAPGQKPVLNVAVQSGYLIDRAEILYWGVCPRCRSSATEGSTP
ncbi:MAG TPA: Fur family transcriptional regulator [Planctomycetota bacterium]|nr:Fur family transcriptional regulator [Planctomycetota bacterium]